ncbi:MAG TPA: cytidylate kinase family protein [Prolixibacteraceae bacterium]|nr:cytidylate kinase family protein [Prolixibacteraceae bacterium]
MVKLDITITGDLGSGKSTVAKALCQMLNFKYFSTGGIQRQIGREQGMNTLELNYFAEKNLDIDKYIDDFVIRLNDEEESFAIDSRMAWHFIRNSFKIYLTVNPIVAAKRVMADCHRDSEQVMEDVYEKSLNLLERRAAEDKRFKSIYGVDCGDLNNYDLVVDTTNSSVEDISKLIVRQFTAFSNKAAINKHWVSPTMLYPTKPAEQVVHGIVYSESAVIETVLLGSESFIINGHDNVSAALVNKVPLIPVVILAKDDEEIHPGEPVSKYIKSAFNLNLLSEWETVHGFQFVTYPKVTPNS